MSPQNKVLLTDGIISLFGLTIGLSLLGWEVKAEEGRGGRSEPKIFFFCHVLPKKVKRKITEKASCSRPTPELNTHS